jgi:hypothetical protein
LFAKKRGCGRKGGGGKVDWPDNGRRAGAVGKKNRKQKTENRKQKMKSKAWQEHGKGMARAYAMQCK